MVSLQSEKGKLSVYSNRVYEYLLSAHDATKRVIKEATGLTDAEYEIAKRELVSQKIATVTRRRGGGLALSLAVLEERTVDQGKKTEAMQRSTMGAVSEGAEKLLAFIPLGGRFVTNDFLKYRMRRQGISFENFYKYKEELLKKGLIKVWKGRGGTVARSVGVKERQSETPAGLVKDEDELYGKLTEYLDREVVANFKKSPDAQAWVRDMHRAKFPPASGHWSRPDVLLVKMKEYNCLPGRDFVVTAYEVKRYKERFNNEGVFEAASHSKYVHECYLAVETSEEELTDEPPDELLRDLRRFGVGFGWLFHKKDKGRYEFMEVLEPERREPDPEEENELLKVFKKELSQDEQRLYDSAIGKK